jgi:hypothetical protein
MSDSLGISVGEVVRTIAKRSRLTQAAVLDIFEMKSLGLSTKQISITLAVSYSVLRVFLPEVSKQVGAKLLKLKAQGRTNAAVSKKLWLKRHVVASYYEANATKFVYTYSDFEFYKRNTRTGNVVNADFLRYNFSRYSSFAELPGEKVLATGGYRPYRSYIIDTRREYAVTSTARMHIPRSTHSSVYYDKHVYAIGNSLVCERYVCDDDYWEEFAVLPAECNETVAMSIVLMEATQSIYLLGGQYHDEEENGYDEDIILRLDLEILDFEVLKVRLPSPGSCIPSFVVSSESTTIYFILGHYLYSLDTLTNEIELNRMISKKLPLFIPCYFAEGNLYYSPRFGPAKPLAIGGLDK